MVQKNCMITVLNIFFFLFLNEIQLDQICCNQEKIGTVPFHLKIKWSGKKCFPEYLKNEKPIPDTFLDVLLSQTFFFFEKSFN